MTRIFCVLCSKHQDCLRAVRNFSSAFVDGITETALKKDNVCKHQQSDMDSRLSLTWSNSRLSMKFTVLRLFGESSPRQVWRRLTGVSKLFDIACFRS